MVAIRKYIIHKYPSLELERRGYLLKQALKRELERGIIRQVRAVCGAALEMTLLKREYFQGPGLPEQGGMNGFRVPENKVR